MIICIDIDNTLCNTTEALCEQFNAYTGEHLSIDDITTYCIEEHVKTQYKGLIEALFNDANMWKRIEVLPDCKSVLRALITDGHEIYFATSTTSKNLNAKRKWLQREFGDIIDAEKSLIGIKNKQLLNADILIDDCASYMTGGNYKGILIDYPWNRWFECDNKNVYRAPDWQCVYFLIRGLKHAAKYSMIL